MACLTKVRYGIDGWPVDMADPFIGLVIGKKWREIRETQGVDIDRPWIPMLDAARALFPREEFKVSDWTEQHFHDWVMEPKLVIWGCASSSKSNDIGFLSVLDWVVDPEDTVTLIGSTTKEDLKKRSWEAVVRCHNLLKASKQFLVPGVVPSRSQSLINVRDSSGDSSATEKAGIHGQALNEDGRMQGAHAKYVRVIVDELAEIKDLEPINTALINLKIGADLKFVGLANPASWENPSCQYCIPEGGISSVDTDTGCWRSTRGVFVRHHDGFKSPCVLNPELAKEFPFLITQDDIDENIRLVDGNMDAPKVWQMVRGFPPPSDAEVPVVLDAKIAREQEVTAPAGGSLQVVGCAAGFDPAWSEGGDGAMYQIVKVRKDVNRGSYPILDFSDIYRLKIQASSPDPVTKQLRDQVVSLMRNPGTFTPPLHATAVDASANQGAADDLDIYIGQGVTHCMHVNFSMRASDNIIRANAALTAKERFRDRATEAWCILAEYCKAGMVRGLSQEVVRAITTRRFATLPNSKVPKFPLQLESKEEFKKRFKKSPDEADAAALGALAVKEILGVLPFGWLSPAQAPAVTPTELPQQVAALPPSDTFGEGGPDYDGIDDMG